MAMTKGTTNASFEGMRHRLLEAEATLSRSISDLALAHEDFLRADQLVKSVFIHSNNGIMPIQHIWSDWKKKSRRKLH